MSVLLLILIYLLDHSGSLSPLFVFLLGTSTRGQMPLIFGECHGSMSQFPESSRTGSQKCSGTTGGMGLVVSLSAEAVGIFGKNNGSRVRTEI